MNRPTGSNDTDTEGWGRPCGMSLIHCAVATILSVLAGPGIATGVFPPPTAEPDSCVDCHEREQIEFAKTRMAEAARTPSFLDEWQEKGTPSYCFGCHSPSGGNGLICVDCHPGPGHPYPKVQVPDTCARCHDAPGESTVRRFRESPAAKRGADCLDCHNTPEGERFSHLFRGPSEPGFLDGVAWLKAGLRHEIDGSVTALVQIGHRAGHALPGGTTGRSVWLVVEGAGEVNETLWKTYRRFGWEHDSNRRWIDQTLPPGRPVALEIPGVDRDGTSMIGISLWYTSAPGPYEPDNADQVLLDKVLVSFSERRRL